MSHSLDVLIPTRPARQKKLCELLEELNRQMRPGAGVLVYRDNEEASYSVACRTLIESSDADYVVFIDDDDWVAANYIERVLSALDSQPDYVGYPVVFTKDGVQQQPVIHSLYDRQPPADAIIRGVIHKNPIRRELALLGKWDGQYGADTAWAGQVQGTGRVQKEEWISEPMYYYRFQSADEAQTPWTKYEGPWPAIPAYDWLTVL